MDESNLDAIQRELELRKLRREGEKLLKGRERYDFMAIKEKHDHERSETERLYRDEYKMRLNVAYEMCLRKAGSPKPQIKPPIVGGGADRFNKNALMRKAEFAVRLAHEKTLARIDQSELKQSRSFLEKSSQRKRFAEQFKSNSDRRQLQKPFTGPNRRHTPTISE